MKQKSILVVSDDMQIADLLKMHIEAEGYAVDSTTSSHEGINFYKKRMHDLVVIDMTLHDCDCIKLAYQLRAVKDTKIVFLTEEDKQKGISLCLVKKAMNKFDIENIDDLLILVGEQFELYKRKVTEKHEKGTYKCNKLRVDLNEKKVWLEGKELSLSEMTTNLLIYLILHEDNYVSKKELYQQVWKNPVSENDSTVMAHIRNLRRKLQDNDVANPLYIHTKRGVGYMFNCASEKK